MGVSTATGAYALVLVVAFLCGYALGARHGPAFRQGAAKKVGPAPAPAPPVRAACTPPPLPTHAPGSQEDHEAVLRWANHTYGINIRQATLFALMCSLEWKG
ncbi:unnamed protein product [Cyclocybe aegerita]|uniref:Uncharacterized protein n=1 Tax=Cyclocybe aegerita TaxID=1973307 RepID=A0A8S0VTR2_CYCAE|nr:unnamed protein product [Cyclocybe aegerita]